MNCLHLQLLTVLLLVNSIFEQEFDHSFPNMISTAYTCISKQLLETFFSQYYLMEHLRVSHAVHILFPGYRVSLIKEILLSM